jgi:hypothetical protein
MAVVGTSQCPITARASVVSTLVGGRPAVAFGQADHKLIQLAAVGETVSSEIENSGVEVERAKTFAVPLLQQCEQPMCCSVSSKVASSRWISSPLAVRVSQVSPSWYGPDASEQLDAASNAQP